MQSNQGRVHILGNFIKNSNFSNIFPPSVRSLTLADYSANPLSQNNTVSVAGISLWLAGLKEIN